MVSTYSDAAERGVDGDLGLWSTHESGERGLVNQLLMQTPVGGIVGPVETRLGIEVLQRTDGAPRELIAVQAIWTLFKSEGLANVRLSRASAKNTAARLAARLAKAPQHFDAEFRARCKGDECSQPVESWERGRGDSVYERVLTDVAIGVSHRPRSKPTRGSLCCAGYRHHPLHNGSATSTRSPRSSSRRSSKHSPVSKGPSSPQVRAMC